MKKELKLHPIQSEILKELIFKPKESFNKLNASKISNDSFNFHLQSLVKSGLIEKKEGKYCLTAIGKEFANRLNVEDENPQIEKQAKIGVLIFAVKKEGGITKYLLQQRLKHPYFGYFGGVGGKLKIGETIIEAAHREFKEEAGLSGKLIFCGVNHKTDFSKQGELLEDKLFFVFKATSLKGKLVQEFQGGKNVWFSLAKIKKLDKLFPDVLDKIKMIENKKISFSENQYFVDEF